MGRGLFLGGQPRPPSQGGVALADANLAGSPLLMHTWLDLEQIRRGNTYGKGVFR